MQIHAYRVCSMEDIIESKRASNRLKDRESLPRLRDYAVYLEHEPRSADAAAAGATARPPVADRHGPRNAGARIGAAAAPPNCMNGSTKADR